MTQFKEPKLDFHLSRTKKKDLQETYWCGPKVVICTLKKRNVGIYAYYPNIPKVFIYFCGFMLNNQKYKDVKFNVFTHATFKMNERMTTTFQLVC